MEAIKFTWDKEDTFDTIHKKLLKLINKKVLNKKESAEQLTIFSVSEIHESFLPCMGSRFFDALEKKENYSKHGEFNFSGVDYIPQWRFTVEYGHEDKHQNRRTTPYGFCIMRNEKENDYKKDLEKQSIVFDPNHPFVFYSFQKK